MEQEPVYVLCQQTNVKCLRVIQGAGDKSLYTRAVVLGLGCTLGSLLDKDSNALFPLEYEKLNITRG